MGPTNSGSKKFGNKKILSIKNFRSNKFQLKRNFGSKTFWFQKFVGSNIFLAQQNDGPRMLTPKKIWPKLFCLEKFLGGKKNLL